MSHPVLSLDQIICMFISPDTPGQRHTAVQNTSLEVHTGEFVSVVGPTGYGKSTLLNLAASLPQPSSGQVQVFGEPLIGINRRAGYMFQAEALMPWRSVLDNVMAGLKLQGIPDKEACDLATLWLVCMGLVGFEGRYLHQLSGGVRKRISLVQTPVLNPDVILMDEPLSALDIQTRQLMENEVLNLWAVKRKAVLFITHGPDEATAMNDRVAVLATGPDTYPIGESTIDLPCPCDVAEIRDQAGSVDLHSCIWDALREGVLKGYVQYHRVV